MGVGSEQRLCGGSVDTSIGDELSPLGVNFLVTVGEERRFGVGVREAHRRPEIIHVVNGSANRVGKVFNGQMRDFA